MICESGRNISNGGMPEGVSIKNDASDAQYVPVESSFYIDRLWSFTCGWRSWWYFRSWSQFEPLPGFGVKKAGSVWWFKSFRGRRVPILKYLLMLYLVLPVLHKCMGWSEDFRQLLSKWQLLSWLCVDFSTVYTLYDWWTCLAELGVAFWKGWSFQFLLILESVKLPFSLEMMCSKWCAVLLGMYLLGSTLGCLWKQWCHSCCYCSWCSCIWN